MEDGWIPLDKDYSVQVEPSVKGSAKYIFRNHKTEIQVLDKKPQPKELGDNSAVSKKIKGLLDIDNRLKKEVINEDYKVIRQILQENYESSILTAEQVIIQEQAEKESILKDKISEAKKVFKDINEPILYIASLTDWFTASERRNIMLSFLAYASQIILKNPISVIALGDASSGKSHILEVALSYIPKEFIVYEKKVTEAVIFNRAKEDEYFYDGKIVFYGDMGGDNDHEDAENCKALMKELQSDGKLDKPLNVPSPNGGWEVKDLHLRGRPLLSYTTIPNYTFDEQELSRSILVTPLMNNRYSFNLRCKYLEFQGKTAQQMQKYQRISELIPYLLLELRAKFSEDIKVINPFVETIHMFLGDTKFFKRDFNKFNGLLKTITALNSINREPIIVDNEQYLFVTREDVALFLSLFAPYRASISSNLSPKASEILSDLEENITGWLESDVGEIKVGLTVNEYIDLSSIDLNKRSVYRYFTELNENGYINTVGMEGKKNIWNLSKKSPKLLQESIMIFDKDKDLILDELGSEFEEYLDLSNNELGIDFMDQHESVVPPRW